MNQILSENLPKGEKRQHKSSIHSILLVFSIFLMIFGIALTSTGAYSYYKNLSNDNDEVISSNTKPEITIERESATIINIVVTHDKEISNVTYTINDETPVQIDGNGQNEIKEQVELPVGEVTLTITAEDVYGISSSYESSYTIEQKPTITLERFGTQIQIIVESTINIDYVKYYWDDDEENGVFHEINAQRTVTYVDAIEGSHTLHVIAVDVEGNEETKSQNIIGVTDSETTETNTDNTNSNTTTEENVDDTEPEITIVGSSDGEGFLITATDEEGLAKIEITLNSNETITEEIDGTEYTTIVDFEDGENKLIVKVYNSSGLSTVKKVKYTKE